ncbi:MAG TPA: plasma-membrane proton-efflux P-type ATPase [Alphaproteobacteria bacterium]|nr:plasma-membrane proton-efflux P-type ATPase [Alphaproteobacteria bacterium]
MHEQSKGLTTKDAEDLLLKYGPNLVEKKKRNRLLIFLLKFWGPISWMLESTIALQLILEKYDEAFIIALLLIFNALLSFFQEERSNRALAILKKNLSIQARVLRDSIWQLIPAGHLVPGDVILVRMGDISPADIRLFDGEVLADQSALTGESLPLEKKATELLYSGSIVKKGEATGEVIATGEKTFFGKTVSLVQTSQTKSHIKDIIFSVVKYLVAVDIFFVLVVLGYALFINHPLTSIIPFVLILLVASIPIALPATFTLATAIGALHLTKRGVLVTRLSAIEEAATMDVLCIDKTGTITQNSLELAELKLFPPYSEERLLILAALASHEATQDPIDTAIFKAMRKRNFSISNVGVINFIPFDPSLKRTEAFIEENGKQLHVLKGAPLVISKLTTKKIEISKEISHMAIKGYRVIAIAVGSKKDKTIELAGLIGFYDPPLKGSKQIIKAIKNFGIRMIMLTGDSIETAKTIAEKVGIGKRVCSSDLIHKNKPKDILKCDAFAGIFPEDKFNMVKSLQESNHIVGMTGDGVNDAPALKQAEVGIAVANAMDVAKSAASIVLVKPGLLGILSAIRTSRRIYQRMLTYTLNKIMKSLEIIVFSSLGFVFANDLIITPFLIVFLLFTNDFASMAIATDRVIYSPKPERWKVAKLMKTGGALAFLVLLFSFSVFLIGKDYLHLPLKELQTLVFLTLVFTGQVNIYLIRERKLFWNSRPSNWLMFVSFMDIAIVSLMAIFGIFMTPLSPLLILMLLTSTAFYLFLIDFIKIRIFSYLNF